MTPESVHVVTFWACIVLVIAGASLALVGVWFEDFFQNKTVQKLFTTDGILFLTALAITIVTKLLR